MPSEVYEVVAQGARYWFLFLMALIVWRSYRWYRRDKRQAKKRMKLLPDAGYVGELVVLEGGGVLKRGNALPVPWEGTLGSLRTNDLCIPVKGVAKRQLWFRFEEGRGLMVEPFHGRAASVDGEETSARRPVYMAHGSRLRVGEVELRLRLFMGFEGTGYAPRREDAEPEQPGQAPTEQIAASDMARQLAQQQQWILQQQWLMRQQLAQQQAYQQWLAQQAGQAQEADWNDDENEEESDGGVYVAPGQATRLSDHTPFMRPPGEAAPQPERMEEATPSTEFEPAGAFYPPEMGEEEWPYAPNPYAGMQEEDYAPGDLDEDMTDAAAPPRSAYIGHDEAERAKRTLWDKYFGGGRGK